MIQVAACAKSSHDSTQNSQQKTVMSSVHTFSAQAQPLTTGSLSTNTIINSSFYKSFQILPHITSHHITRRKTVHANIFSIFPPHESASPVPKSRLSNLSLSHRYLHYLSPSASLSKSFSLICHLISYNNYASSAIRRLPNILPVIQYRSTISSVSADSASLRLGTASSPTELDKLKNLANYAPS